jgi:predicted DNA-binding protein with PD1-like motif
MRYSEAKLGRVFYLRVDHGEDLLAALENFVTDMKISSGMIHFLGAIREGRIVTGPKEAVLPPDPSFETYEGGWEVFGIATITPGSNGPHLHLHGSVGRKKEVLAGCLREKAVAYIIVEAIIIELAGADIFRRTDPVTGLVLPEPGEVRRP